MNFLCHECGKRIWELTASFHGLFHSCQRMPTTCIIFPHDCRRRATAGAAASTILNAARNFELIHTVVFLATSAPHPLDISRGRSYSVCFFEMSIGFLKNLFYSQFDVSGPLPSAKSDDQHPSRSENSQIGANTRKDISFTASHMFTKDLYSFSNAYTMVVHKF